MSKIDLQISDELSTHVAALAERKGVTPHDFIVQTITETVTQAQLDDDFYDEAERRYAKFLRTGEYITLEDLQGYIDGLLNGETPEPLVARKLGSLP